MLQRDLLCWEFCILASPSAVAGHVSPEIIYGNRAKRYGEGLPDLFWPTRMAVRGAFRALSTETVDNSVHNNGDSLYSTGLAVQWVIFDQFFIFSFYYENQWFSW